ncbi:hypothetical protein NL108_000527, partial [Boleophthalmus pectinirostris]
LLISIYPFVKAWLNINHILPSFGKFSKVHPTAPNPIPEQTIDALKRDGDQLNLERSKSRMGTFMEGGRPGENPDEGYKNVP